MIIYIISINFYNKFIKYDNLYQLYQFYSSKIYYMQYFIHP